MTISVTSLTLLSVLNVTRNTQNTFPHTYENSTQFNVQFQGKTDLPVFP